MPDVQMKKVNLTGAEWFTELTQPAGARVYAFPTMSTL